MQIVHDGCHSSKHRCLVATHYDDYVSSSSSTTTMRSGTTRCYCALWLALLALASFVTAQSDPTHSISSFENLPARIFFFDDTNVRMNISQFYAVLMLP